MNERIRELVEQADFTIYDQLDSNALDPFIEKFAELIVRECIAITNDQYFAYEAVEALQKNFGVKEND